MPLPDSIPVKYSEEEAEYLSLRPVVRQTFRMRELVDMILSVTGKDAARIRQVLRSGTAVFHFYRYWWQGFEADETELARLLQSFPDAQPDRPFRFAECEMIHLEAAPGQVALRLNKAQSARRGLLRRRSLWDSVGATAQQCPPAYSHYSYDQRADCFVANLLSGDWPVLQQQWLSCAPRNLRPAISAISAIARIFFFCPRP